MFRPIIRQSTGRYFCYRNTVWSNVSNYSAIFKNVRLLVRIFRRMMTKDDIK